MPFRVGKDLSVLEAKFQIYEDLSKEMLDKLERAVDRISEGNQAVALILERHENRLEQVDKADAAILELIKDLKDKIREIEKKLEEVSQIKWMTLGCGAVLVVLAGAFSTLASGWWTPAGMQDAASAAKAPLTSK
jgi:DNA repair exonuclease SbcCD ATPase subunit